MRRVGSERASQCATEPRCCSHRPAKAPFQHTQHSDGRPCWRYANKLLTDRQQQLDSRYQLAELQPTRSRAAARADPRRRQRAVRRARLRRGLDRGHRQLSRRHPRARAPLLRRSQGGLHRAARAARRPARGRAPAAERSQRSCARGGFRLTLAGLDRGEPNDLARDDGTRRGHRRPRGQARSRRPRAPRRRAAHGLSRRHRRGLATAALRARMLDRAQPRRDTTLADGDATREATHELLASTLEHVLRTFGAPPAPSRRASLTL